MYKILYDLTQIGWQVKLKQHEGMSILSKGTARIILHWEMRYYETYNFSMWNSDEALKMLESQGFTSTPRVNAKEVANG